MKKSLYIIRHGKSSWGYENVTDLDRPLKNRGIRNSYEMSGQLKEKGVKPDLIVASPAIRALHTSIIFAAELDYPYKEVRIDEMLYFSEENIILEYIKKTTDAVSSLLIFGHNPIVSNLANIFLNKKVDYIPTTGIVELVFESNSWSRIEKSCLVNEWFGFPKKN